jgi:hypothetical protein
MFRRLIGPTLLAIGLTYLITASITLRREWRFHREATAIDATVTGVSPSGIEYEFAPPGHAPVHGSASTTATKGSSILVFYLPTDPQQSRITTWFRNIGWICAGYLLGAACMFVGGIALLPRRGRKSG